LRLSLQFFKEITRSLLLKRKTDFLVEMFWAWYYASIPCKEPSNVAAIDLANSY